MDSSRLHFCEQRMGRSNVGQAKAIMQCLRASQVDGSDAEL